MQAMQNAGHSNENNNNGGGGNRNVNRDTDWDRSRNRNKKTPDTAAFQRTEKLEYCWMHGACNHKSDACSRKAPGHKTNATLANRMGDQTLSVGN